MLTSSKSSINYPASITNPEIILKCFQYYPLMLLRKKSKDFNDTYQKECKLLQESTKDQSIKLNPNYLYFLNYPLSFNEFKKLSNLDSNILQIYFNVFEKFSERELILKGNKKHETEFNKIFNNKNKLKVNLQSAFEYFKVYHSDYLLLNEEFNNYLIKKLINNQLTSSKSINDNQKKQFKNNELIIKKEKIDAYQLEPVQFKINNQISNSNQNIIFINNLDNNNNQLIKNSNNQLINKDDNKINQYNEFNYIDLDSKKFFKEHNFMDGYTEMISKRNDLNDKNSLIQLCKSLGIDNTLNNVNQLTYSNQQNELNQLNNQQNGQNQLNTNQQVNTNQVNRLNQVNISNQKNAIVQLNGASRQIKRSLSDQQISQLSNQQKTIIQLNTSCRYAQSYTNIDYSLGHKDKKNKTDNDHSIYLNQQQKILLQNLEQKHKISHLNLNQQIVQLNFNQQQNILKLKQHQKILELNQQRQVSLLNSNQQQQKLMQKLMQSNQKQKVTQLNLQQQQKLAQLSRQQQKLAQLNPQQKLRLKMYYQQQDLEILKGCFGYGFVNDEISKQIYNYLETNKNKNYKQLDLKDEKILFNLPIDKFMMIYGWDANDTSIFNYI